MSVKKLMICTGISFAGSKIQTSAFTVVALLLDEYLSPFGPNVFDPADIAAGVVGVALAALVFHTFIRGRLTFGDEAAPVASLCAGKVLMPTLRC